MYVIQRYYSTLCTVWWSEHTAVLLPCQHALLPWRGVAFDMVCLLEEGRVVYLDWAPFKKRSLRPARSHSARLVEHSGVTASPPIRTSWDSHRTPTSRSCRTGTQPTLWTSTWGICLRLTRRDSANSGMHLIFTWNKCSMEGNCEQDAGLCVYDHMEKLWAASLYNALLLCWCLSVFWQPERENWGRRHSSGLLQESHHRWSHEDVGGSGKLIFIFILINCSFLKRLSRFSY